jgi:xylan 1,4-beta-xylosidase
MPLSAPASFDTRDKAVETLNLGEQEILSLRWTGLKPCSSVLIEILDKSHGNAMAAWEASGSSESPSREQLQLLRKAAEKTRQESYTADASGDITLELQVEPWTVILATEL